ncbi:hypothetical protein R0K05_11535 [Planococcus sp. SIMBA_160]
MNHFNNERGYALVIVMLLVVLFLGFFATFLAGSLNHVTQERTVDTSNQSVAAAEMGVLYYTANFEKELELELLEIQQEVNERLEILKKCKTCNFEEDLKKLNIEKKEEYKNAVVQKVMDLNLPEGAEDNFKREISVDGDTAYTIESASAEIASDNTKIRVELQLEGIAKQGDAESEKILDVFFNIIVPDSFLTKSTQIIYDDIYKTPPTISCAEFLNTKKYLGEGIVPYYECTLGDNKKLAGLLVEIKAHPHNLNPQDFLVYTDKYLENVCDPNGNSKKEENANCNSKDFEGISIMVYGEEDTVTKNMNGLEDIKIYIDGQLSVKNLNNTSNAVLVLKELVVDNNSQNIENSTIVVLGLDEASSLAELKVDNNITLKTNAKFCLDADRIIQSDIKTFESKININEGSWLYYYTSPSSNKGHFLTNPRAKKITDYSEFLSLCNVSVNGSPTANDIDPGFDFEVEY